jgi:GAF domain-containing protein
MTHEVATGARREDVPIRYETIRDLTSTLSVSTVIERLLARVLSHLDSEIASILLAGPDRVLRVTHAEGLPEAVVRESTLASGEGISGHVFQSGEALLIENIELDARFGRSNHERYYTNSAISVPLRSQGRMVGVLNVNNKHNREPFTLDDLRLVEAIAGHAAIALFNAQRYQETLEKAQHDALTGLANHGHFWSNLEHELRRAPEAGPHRSGGSLFSSGRLFTPRRGAMGPRLPGPSIHQSQLVLPPPGAVWRATAASTDPGAARSTRWLHRAGSHPAPRPRR